MNEFLKSLEITYRRDIESGRPRVNKFNSRLDKEQKSAQEMFPHYFEKYKLMVSSMAFI